MQKLMKVLLAAMLLTVTPIAARAGESPIKGGGNFGLGLVVGDPGNWGAVGKIWIDSKNAFQPAVKLGGGTATLQLDYLWHTYDVIDTKQGLVPLYIGAGGDLVLQNTVAVAARGVGGISYMFDRSDVPVDIFLQLAPTLWFFSGGTSFNLYGELGARYYF
jgi:hypothetical protein